MIVEVMCRGLTPLFMNKMSDDTLERIRTKTKESKTAKVGTTKTVREEAESKVYFDESGPYIPGSALMACLIAAGQYIRLDGKRQISTQKSTMLPGLMSLLTDRCYVKVPGTDKAAVWEADVRQGRNPNGGEAVAICRPRFDEWGFSFSIEIEEQEIGVNVIRELIDKAGRRVGLLDFRPAKKGIFGQFVVECWDPQT